jgi:hypothetical protein
MTEEKKVKHSPTPWIFFLREKNKHDVEVFQIDQHEEALAKEGEFQAVCLADVFGDEANAEFIVHACNSHYDLLAKVSEYETAYNNQCKRVDDLNEEKADLLEAVKKLYMAVYAGNSHSLKDAMNRAPKDDQFEQEIIAVIRKAEQL